MFRTFLFNRRSFNMKMPLFRNIHSSGVVSDTAKSPNTVINRWKNIEGYQKVLIGVTFVVGGVYILYYDSEWYITNAMVKKFELGDVGKWDAKDLRATVERDMSAILECLQPSEDVDNYLAVVGESGTGKSTLIRKCIRSIPVNEKKKKGVVYFPVSSISVTKFSSELGSALEYRQSVSILGGLRAWLFNQPSQSSSATSPDEPFSPWDTLKPHLLRAAVSYKEKHMRPPVLVIDAADTLAKRNPSFFLEIQKFARECAESGDLVVMFVFSDSTLPVLMDSSNSAKKLLLKPLEVGDISDAQAVAFLQEKYKMEHPRAVEMVSTITGGRFKLLKQFGKSSDSLDSIREELFIDTNKSIKLLGMTPTHPLFQRLLDVADNKGTLKSDDAIDFLPEDKIRSLLASNIISSHPSKTFTFQSRHVVIFFRTHIEEEKRAKLEEEKRKSWFTWLK